MTNVQSVNSMEKVNFKADNDTKSSRQTVPYNQSQAKIMRADEFIREQEKKDKQKKVKNGVVAGIGILSSAVILAYFGRILFKDINSEKTAKTIEKQLQKLGENHSQIKRAVENELGKGAQQTSMKKVDALMKFTEIQNSKPKEIDIKKLKESLDSKVIGMEDIKQEVIQYFTYRNKCIQKGIPMKKPLVLSLDGPAGTAKTTIAEAIAEAAGMPSKTISMAGATGKARIVGTESVYTGASWGEIADAQLEHKTNSIVYVVDELEKAGTSDHNGKAVDSFISGWDDRALIHDDFLDIDVKTNNSIFIVTTNDRSKLSEHIQDRMTKKFNIKPYTIAEKAAVGKFKFDKLLKFNKLENEIEIQDGVCEKIAQMATDRGGREVSNNVQNIIERATYEMEKAGQDKITITPQMAEDWILHSVAA